MLNKIAANISAFTVHSVCISPGSLVIPGDYLSVISCYYQLLVEVPRPTARDRDRSRHMATVTTRTPVDA